MSGTDPHEPVSRRALTRSADTTDDSPVRRAMPLFLALLFAILTVVGILLLIELQHVMLLLFISFLFAAALAKPTARLEQLRIPRVIAALLIYVAFFGVFVGLGWYVVPTLFGQVANLAGDAPEYADRYDNVRERYDELAEQYNLGTFDEQFAGFRARIIDSIGERLINLPTRMFGVFLDVLAVFVLSLLILTSRERLLTFILSMVHPRHRDETRDVLSKMWVRVGYYLRAKIIVMIIVGVLTYVSLIVIGVPYALLLSILVALGEVIPRIGAWIARIPLLAIAALEGWMAFGLTAVSSVLIQNLEGSIISPFIQGDQLDIHPIAVFVAVLVGATLLGPAGAFVAVPFAAMVQVFVEEVVIPWRRAQIAPAEAADPTAG